MTTNYSIPTLLNDSKTTVNRAINGKIVTVDSQDAHFLDEYGWYVTQGYVVAATPKNNSVQVRLHNLILPPPDGLEVDHRDRNGLNNTRDNLRHATRAQNLANRGKFTGCTSPYKGVYFHKMTGKWQATITENGRQVYLGLHTDPADAARAYDREALRIHGPFARLNFPAVPLPDAAALRRLVAATSPECANGRLWTANAAAVVALRDETAKRIAARDESPNHA